MNVMLRLSVAALLVLGAGSFSTSVLSAPGNGGGPPNGVPGNAHGPGNGNGPGSGNGPGTGNGSPNGNQGNGPDAGSGSVNTVPEPSTLILSLAALGILARVVSKKRTKK